VRHAAAWNTVEEHYRERSGVEDPDADEEEGNELDDIDGPDLSGDLDDYDLDRLVDAVEQDMTLLADLLTNVYARLSPATDDKLQKLIDGLRRDPLLKGQKVVLFTEFRDTARYLFRELKNVKGLAAVEELDSSRKVNREEVIKRFAPYYNCTARELPRYADEQIRVLISTDVLSEGLNLQDASRIINYDLHWNPVRLMQRIGRIDRRLNPAIEAQLGRPVNPPVKVHVFNFLLKELNDVLGLYRRITGKLLRISKTLGIEAPLLTPDDEFEAVRLFNERYEGRQSTEEKLQRELDQLRTEHPELYAELPTFPRRAFSGRQAGDRGTKGLFCAYRFPPPHAEAPGELRWYFRVSATGQVWDSDQLAEIAAAISSAPDTPRATQATAEELKEWREAIERDRVLPHLRALQAPLGTKAVLVCWMEVW
jgi:superfamily II DNA/RNA helicase